MFWCCSRRLTFSVAKRHSFKSRGRRHFGACLATRFSEYFLTAGRSLFHISEPHPDSRSDAALSNLTVVASQNVKRKRPPCGSLFLFKHSVLAPTYSPLASTIGSRGLNCRVRKENGCDPSDKAPTQNAQMSILRPLITKSYPALRKATQGMQELVYKQKASRDSHNSFREFCRGISTPRLNTLLCFHLVPINVVISYGP